MKAPLVSSGGGGRMAGDLLIAVACGLMACAGARVDGNVLSSSSFSSVADTTAPAVPADWTESLDSSRTVPSPWGSDERYYRDRFLLGFKATASGRAIREVLARYEATVVGGVPELHPRGGYVIAIPDPGPRTVQWLAIYDSLAAEPTVEIVLNLPVGRPLRADR
jgi:hypothetical protein